LDDNKSEDGWKLPEEPTKPQDKKANFSGEEPEQAMGINKRVGLFNDNSKESSQLQQL
jgi:hypothetical protein